MPNPFIEDYACGPERGLGLGEVGNHLLFGYGGMEFADYTPSAKIRNPQNMRLYDAAPSALTPLTPVSAHNDPYY